MNPTSLPRGAWAALLATIVLPASLAGSCGSSPATTAITGAGGGASGSASTGSGTHGGQGGSCVSTSATKIDILFSKEDIVGGIYYWQSAVYGGIGGKTGGIYSHDFGSLDPAPTPFYTSGGTGTCVGCHYLSRDGAWMSLATDDPDADDEFADVKSHLMDVATRTVLGGAKMSPGFQTFTHDHPKSNLDASSSGPTSPGAAHRATFT